MSYTSPVISAVARDTLRHKILHDMKNGLEYVTHSLSLMRKESFASLSRVVAHYCSSVETVLACLEALESACPRLLQAIFQSLQQRAWQDTCVLDPAGNQNGTELTVAEQREALKLLQGLCLVHERMRVAAVQQGIIQTVLERVGQGPGPECLDTLCVVLTVSDTPAAVHQFLDLNGVSALLDLLQVPDTSQRRACVQFFIILFASILPRWKACQINALEAEHIIMRVKQQVATIFGNDTVERFCMASALTAQVEATTIGQVGNFIEKLVTETVTAMSPAVAAG